jgi:predicted nucleic acid-binding protein
MLELARSRGLPLLTLDARLSAVAQGAGIDLVEVL